MTNVGSFFLLIFCQIYASVYSVRKTAHLPLPLPTPVSTELYPKVLLLFVYVISDLAKEFIFPLLMAVLNNSEVQLFLLIGIPGLEHAHEWISIPICLLYLVAIMGNSTILFIIKTEPSLHEPMYYFLAMLAISDLGLSFSSLPTMLRIFLFNAMEISPNACFAQEFFIHGFTVMESSVLLVMSSDRFLAIHNPLIYNSLLTSNRVAKMGLILATRSLLLVLPFPFMLRRLKYCQKNVLSHSYCLHQDTMKLACSDNKINVIYGSLLLSVLCWTWLSLFFLIH